MFPLTPWQEFFWVARKHLPLRDSESSVLQQASRSVLSLKTWEPQAQALWVVAFASEPGNPSFGPCLAHEPPAANTIRI